VECVAGVGRWTVGGDCVVDSRVCLQTCCWVVVVVVVRKKQVLDTANVSRTGCNNSMQCDQQSVISSSVFPNLILLPLLLGLS
jgi:hypothetical protein